MRFLGKTALIALLLLLIVFSVLADLPIGQALKIKLDLRLYLKLVSLLGLLIAVFVTWGYKLRIESSQKYRRADEVLTQAQETFDRKKKACDELEHRLNASFVQKEQALDQHIEEVKAKYQQRILVLKEQNVELKETVGKLMRALGSAQK